VLIVAIQADVRMSLTGGFPLFRLYIPASRPSVAKLACAERLAMTDILDAQGLKCPLPVLRARKKIRDIEPGGSLTVLATDPAALRDFQAFCEQTGHPFVSGVEADGIYTIVLQRKL
jgi:tRNA 2-thiouridine synthesizing protein A